MIRVMGFKGSGNLADWLIRRWTRSPYSHVEIEVNGIRYGSRPGIGVVADRTPVAESEWDAVPVPAILIDHLRLESWFRAEVGSPYDWRGLTVAAFGWGWESRRAWFCSEFVIAGLRSAGILPDDGRRPCEFTPRDAMSVVSDHE